MSKTQNLNYKLEQLELKRAALALSLEQELEYERTTKKRNLLLSKGYAYQIKKLDKYIYEIKRRSFNTPLTAIKNQKELERRKTAVGVSALRVQEIQSSLIALNALLANPLGTAKTQEEDLKILSDMRSASKELGIEKTKLATRRRSLAFWLSKKK